MNNRVAQLRKHLGMTQEAFGKRIGLTDAMVSMIESGKKAIQNRTVSLICYSLGVNEDWLRYGRGNMLSPKAEAEDERQLLAMFEKLSDEMKRVVLQKVKDLLAADETWKEVLPIREVSPIREASPSYGQTNASQPDTE